MIREDNYGDTNKHFMRCYHEAGSLHLEKCKMVWKIERFYRIRKREQGREK